MRPNSNKELKELYKTFAPIFKEEKTQKFSTILLTLGALSLFGIFAINPTITTIVHLQKQLSDSRFVEEKLQQKIASLSSLQSQYTIIRDDIPPVLQAIPKKPTVPMFAAQLQGIAKNSNITIEKLQILQVELSQNPNSENYGSFVFSLDVAGQQGNLTEFLSSLISFERIASIQSISYGNTKIRDDLLLSLQGKAYFKP